MQAPIVPQAHIDFTTLSNLSPKAEAPRMPEPTSENKKSFEDMIRDAKNTESPSSQEKAEEAPVAMDGEHDSEPVFQDAKRDNTPIAEAEKSAQEQKVPQNALRGTQKKTVELDAKKTASLHFDKAFENGTSPQGVSDAVKASQNAQKKLVSPGDIQNLLEELKNLAHSAEEKDALSIEDVKKLMEDDPLELAAVLSAGEQLLKTQQDGENLIAQTQENIFDSELSSIDEVSDGAKPRTIALDADQKILVKDFRSEQPSLSWEQAENAPEMKEKSEKLTLSDVKIDGNSAELTLEAASSVQQNVTASSSQAAGATGSDFQAMLANQIRANAGDIVRAGTVVLKDNDVGSIKLILKPENLGNVKVDLQLSDKNITGRIVVATQEAFNAFKESADSLKQAFLNSGFENASFDLAFAGQNASQDNSGSRQENPGAGFRMSRAYGALLDDSSSEFLMQESAEFEPVTSVNIVA